jgi:putative SOS response-associated peptidase YedK
MCGRFTLTERDLVRLARALGAEVDPALAGAWRPRFNVAPGQQALLVRALPPARGERGAGLRLEGGRFGLGGSPGPLRFNARAETAAERRPFRAAWESRRCAVPADGFYEWGGGAEARRPTWFHDPARRPLLLAGLWGEEEGGALAFAILTTAARGPVAALHDRMPVLLPPGGLRAWLEGGAPPGAELALGLAAREVSPRVNAVANDDEACLEAPAPARQLRLV